MLNISQDTLKDRLLPASYLIILILGVVVLVITFLLGSLFQNRVSFIAPRKVVDISSNELSKATPVNTSDEGVLETYQSKKLGIIFSYFKYKNSKTLIRVEESGDTIRLFAGTNQISASKTIQVFEKDPNKTLNETIVQKFLAGYSSDNCQVTIPKLDRKYHVYIPNSEYLAIEVVNPSKEFPVYKEQTRLCPDIFTYSWKGISYFMADKDTPNKYIFVDLGQDNFSSYPGLTWDMTIRFLK